MGIIKRKLMVMHRTQPEAPAEILAFLVCLAEVTFLAAWTLEPTVPALLPSATELTWLFGTEAAVSTLDPYLAPTFREHPAQNGQRVFLCVFSAKEDSNYHSSCIKQKLDRDAKTLLRNKITRKSRKTTQALAGVAQWLEHQPANQKVTSSIPSQGTCLGCGPGPQ